MLNRIEIFVRLSTLTVIAMLAQATEASAQTAATGSASAPSTLMMNLPIILAVGGLFYFGIIRPQQQQAKTHGEFLKKLDRGDEVVTASGIIGRIVGMTDRVVTLEVSPKIEMKILRTQVQGLLKDSVLVEQKS